MTDLAYRTARELAALIRDGQISSLELTDACIDRIERLDGEVNAVVVRDFERARAAARAADAKLAAGDGLGPLHGVPMTIKESYNIEGLPTTWGHPIFAKLQAPEDSEAVRRFKEAGAVFLGKTNVPLNLADFQSYNDVYGTTRNPWNRERTPGGSSGGSAAALAAGFVSLEAGSDIGGSIRNPAHYCGVYGHKPTWGIVPPQGHALPGMLAGPDIAVCGTLARDPDDLRLALDVLSGPEPLNAPGWRLELPKPRRTQLADFRVALWATDERCPVDREVADRVAMIGETLAKLGATVSDTARPNLDLDRGHSTYLTLLNSIMGAAMPDEQRAEMQAVVDAADPTDASTEVAMARGVVASHRTWLAANNEREGYRYAWRDFFDDWDILICPQTATPAFPHDHSPMSGRTLVVNDIEQNYFDQLFWAGFVIASYLPSTVFPTGPSREGLPIGLQAVSGEYGDHTTIEFARLIAERIGGCQVPPDFGG